MAIVKKKIQWVVVVRGRNRWDVQVFGPWAKRGTAEEKANEKLKEHPLLSVGVFPIAR